MPDPAVSPTDVLNVAFYRFARLAELPALRAELKALCRELGLMGTILLAPEGINGFLAGTVATIAEFRRAIGALHPALADLECKESVSPEIPFRRMLVKLKREIISMGWELEHPEAQSGARLTTAELRRWLDAGKDVVLLDTRNDYEIRFGTFQGAVDMGLQTFRSFPQKLRQLPAEMRDKPVVMFCTGGIRCEKATAAAKLEGFKDVYQLDGGILRWFEQQGGAHYQGDCFVFDRRVALKPDLSATGAELCFACRTPLQPMDLRSPRYVMGVSCGYCADGDADSDEDGRGLAPT